MQLRDYQEEVIEETRNAFRKGYKAPCVVLPCGGGKTVCFAYMANEHIKMDKNHYVWFLVHRRELVDQTLETFKMFNISTDNVLIGMVQSTSRNLDKFKRPTLIIFDEAHHATARTWTRITEAFNEVPKVGLTATPARTDGTGLGKIFDSLVVGVQASDLIRRGFLCEYDYYAPKLPHKFSLKERGRDYDMKDLAEQFEKSKIYGDVLKYIDMNRKTIIYCPTIEFSKNLSKQIEGSTHFDGKTPKTERDQIIKDFRSGKIRVLLNVDLIGEGFDVPDCDCVILLRPTKSTVLYIQQSMRCLRPAPNKRAVIYDLAGNCYRHGLPTENRKWSLDSRIKCKNESGEKDILCRQCKECLLVYEGSARLCPFCGVIQPKNIREIEEDKQAELEKIEELQRKKDKIELKEANKSLQGLIEYGRERGYKKGWAYKKWGIINKYRKKYNN